MDHVTRVRAWLKEQSYDGVILSRRDNFTTRTALLHNRLGELV